MSVLSRAEDIGGSNYAIALRLKDRRSGVEQAGGGRPKSAGFQIASMAASCCCELGLESATACRRLKPQYYDYREPAHPAAWLYQGADGDEAAGRYARADVQHSPRDMIQICSMRCRGGKKARRRAASRCQDRTASKRRCRPAAESHGDAMAAVDESVPWCDSHLTREEEQHLPTS